jgi:hypothetical protein
MKNDDINIKITHKSVFGKITYEIFLKPNDVYFEEECDEMFTLCVRVLKGAGFTDLQIKKAMQNWLNIESESTTSLFIDFTEKNKNK